ncbi:MAG: pyridoxamine 5'-phosphate oxidase [Bacteroidota bacterium]
MSISKKLPDMRQDYELGKLDESQLADNPFLQFEQWFKEADESEVMEANAMILATVSEAKPSQRVVLLKGFDEGGFLFYTNYESRKAGEIARNPFGSLCFYWDRIERQVRIEGRIEKATAEESDTYYQQRGRGSRIGAWASPQSQLIEDRAFLENRVQEIAKKFEDQERFPRPEYWGGYRLIPEYFEFWQGRKSRLHDRIFYKRSEGVWEMGRLAP